MTNRVLLVDDVDDVRVVVRHALLRRGDFEVVAEAASGMEAIALAEAHRPDLVVLDAGLPDLAGREVLSRLRAVSPESKVVVFTGTEMADRAAIAREADAFVLKGVELDYLLDLLEHLARATQYSAVVDIAADPVQVRVAREFVTRRCTEWGCADASDEAAVIVSELVTNAIIHAQTSCRVCVRRSPGVVRIEVTDSSELSPDPRLADDEDEHGRGLLLVSVMAVAWGVAPAPEGGKLVWAELLCNDPMPADAITA